jgi:hypothetical protein
MEGFAGRPEWHQSHELAPQPRRHGAANEPDSILVYSRHRRLHSQRQAISPQAARQIEDGGYPGKASCPMDGDGAGCGSFQRLALKQHAPGEREFGGRPLAEQHLIECQRRLPARPLPLQLLKAGQEGGLARLQFCRRLERLPSAGTAEPHNVGGIKHARIFAAGAGYSSPRMSSRNSCHSSAKKCRVAFPNSM